MTNVEQYVVPGAGHFIPAEAPEKTWRLIAGFAQL